MYAENRIVLKACLGVKVPICSFQRCFFDILTPRCARYSSHRGVKSQRFHTQKLGGVHHTAESASKTLSVSACLLLKGQSGKILFNKYKKVGIHYAYNFNSPLSGTLAKSEYFNFTIKKIGMFVRGLVWIMKNYRLKISRFIEEKFCLTNNIKIPYFIALKNLFPV